MSSAPQSAVFHIKDDERWLIACGWSANFSRTVTAEGWLISALTYEPAPTAQQALDDAVRKLVEGPAPEEQAARDVDT